MNRIFFTSMKNKWPLQKKVEAQNGQKLTGKFQ